MNSTTRQHRGLLLKIAVTWACVFLLAGFLFAGHSLANGVNLSVIPEVPRVGEPVVATFTIAGTEQPADTYYELYVNGKLAESGTTFITPGTSIKYRYAYESSVEPGEQVTFYLKTGSAYGEYEKSIALPAYPPQLMSSFVSLAAFSTSVMSTMVTAQYFNDAFGTTEGINTGVIITVVLLLLLLFLELTQSIRRLRNNTILSSYRVASLHVSTILFVIMLGIVFTKVAMMITA